MSGQNNHSKTPAYYLDRLDETAKNRLEWFNDKTVLAQKWPVVPLLTVVGSVLIIAAPAFKFELLGQTGSNLTPPEFIAAILLGGFLVVLGAFLRMYQYKVGADFVRIELRNSAQIIETLADAQNSASGKDKDREDKHPSAEMREPS